MLLGHNELIFTVDKYSWNVMCFIPIHTYTLSNSTQHLLTLKHWETHVCMVSTVATDAPVLKHQAISIHSAD